eukprot:CAMPEP_0114571358 /NCGR_PEP_ID=MMETSP0114-20121206/17704_1 /TAXON_ID=31324 /ORGANISM="Goniomonas sp, Strain m" /LENGTH=253 /DNA_ID=CAMNT_0001758473 /DNA_START=77 /DNA_END=839 /DNA_ORIENTATION=-
MAAAPSESREDLVLLAKVAEEAEREEDMLSFMLEVFRHQDATAYSHEEQQLLKSALRGATYRLRSSFRFAESHCLRVESAPRAAMARDYCAKLGKALADKLTEAMIVWKNRPTVASGEDIPTQMFFLQLESWTYTVLHEVEKDQGLAIRAEENAYALAVESLYPTNIWRLFAAQSLSIKYDAWQRRDDARRVAKEAFDDAIGALDFLDDKDYKETTLVMQSLRDSVTLWTATDDDEDKEEQEGVLLVKAAATT